MMHVFIDANIFIRVATQGRPGCERRHFDDLRTLVENHAFNLLVPEVVHLEVEKALRSLGKDIESNCDSLGDKVRKATNESWNEIDSLKTEVLDRIKQFKKERVFECVNLSKSILEFLGSDSVTTIRLTPEIMVDAKRRQIAGKMPDCRKASDQDALIVESLASHLQSCEGLPNSLFFCTENTKDFALEVGVPDELDRNFVLAPDIQEALPQTHFFTDLASMLTIARGFEQLSEPSNAEIEAALEKRDLHADLDDINDSTFLESHGVVMDAVNKEYARQFEEDVLPSLPKDIQVIRSRLSSEIEQILARCRDCRSWGERSEYKLPQWVEFVDESMIPYTSLPKLVTIRNSLNQFLEVHRKMDREIASKEASP